MLGIVLGAGDRQVNKANILGMNLLTQEGKEYNY